MVGRLSHLALGSAFVLFATTLARATPPQEPLDPADRSAALSVVGRRLALVVGTSDYAAAPAWPRLPNASGDADAVGDELAQRYGFAVTRPADRTMTAFKVALKGIADAAGPADDVLVFVAGHGYFDVDDNAGYLVFADSERRCGANCYAFDNVKRALYGTHARHVLVVLDVCHAGAFDVSAAFEAAGVRESGDTARPLRKSVRDYAQYPSRFLLASVANAPTSDGPPGTHSPFVTTLLSVLSNPGPAGVVSLERLYVALAEDAGLPVVRPSGFGSIVPPHPNGTFLFIEDVKLCDAVHALLAAAGDGFAAVSRAGDGGRSDPWAVTSPASWLVPGARRCDVWRWEADDHDELRCDLGAFDRAMAEEKARDTFRAVRECVAAIQSEPSERERTHGPSDHHDLLLALSSLHRTIALSSVCDATCALSLVIE